jgi:hypothetical protein
MSANVAKDSRLDSLEEFPECFSGAVEMPLNIVVAHDLEAKPLVKMFGLQRQTLGGYKLYQSSEGVSLIVSGMGTDAVKDATFFLGEQQKNDEGRLRAWLNIGIAGHKTAELGSSRLANKITEQASGCSVYPPQLFKGIKSCKVVTVDEPETHYPEEAAYEMEASAFYGAATKFSTGEMVQVLKIISDNSCNPVHALDLSMVPAWISSQEKKIRKLADGLVSFANDHNRSHEIPASYQEICNKYHLTVSQKIQLRSLCQRYKAMGRESDLLAFPMSSSESSKQLILKLTIYLEQLSSE